MSVETPPLAKAPLPLTIDARVWLVEDIDAHNRIVVGTVESISPAGYVRVAWDDSRYPVSHFSPATAGPSLRVVTGEDAKRRHDWDTSDPTFQNVPCRWCGTQQTDENEFGACRDR